MARVARSDLLPNMAVACKHFVILLVCVLLVYTGEQVDAAKGHFRRKDVSGRELNTNLELRTRRSKDNRSHRRETEVKQLQTSSKHKDEQIHTVLAQTGSMAVLHCDIEKLIKPRDDNYSAIWVKWNPDDSYTMLTVNSTVLAYDKRFSSSNRVSAMDWILYIRYTQPSDEGLYECQACVDEDHSSTFVRLKLQEARACIIGGDKKVVEKPGSPLRLSCVLENSIEPPTYIFWYHWDRMINYDLNDGATVREGPQGSELIFPMAQRKHVGNYSCVPSNAKPASVEVSFLTRDTSNTGDSKRSCGKKSHQQDHIVNMLVLISAFHLL